MTNPVICVIVALCVIAAAASLLYGVLRRFTRMGWLAWQLPLIFVLTFFVRLLPRTWGAETRFAFTLLIIFGATALVLGGGALLRLAMHKKRRPAHIAWRVFDRVLGGVTALLDYVLILVVLASAALPFLYYATDVPALDFLFTNDVWLLYFADCAFDFFVVTLFVLFIRTGWRVGFARMVVILIMLALTVGSLGLSAWLAFAVDPFTKISAAIGNAIGMGGFSFAIGAGIVTLILFIILFILVCLLGALMVALIRAIRFHYFWGTIDGVIGALLMFAAAVALFVGLSAGVQFLASGNLAALIDNAAASLGEAQEALQGVVDLLKGVVSSVEAWAIAVRNMFLASPISAALFSLIG